MSRWSKRIPEHLWKKFNEALVAVARRRGISSGRKMRFDTTVVETDIHYPTDSSLLEDGIKKLGNLAKKAKRLGIAEGEVVRDFTRSAKKRVLAIVKYAGKRSEENLERVKKYYAELVIIGKRSVAYAKKVTTAIVQASTDLEKKVARHIERLNQQYQKYIPRIEQVIEQTVRRVFHGEAVRVDEKLVSIHEPHSYPVCKGKRAQPVEFGQVVKIQEADGKMITDWQSYPSQPADCNLFLPAIDRHMEIFKRPPHLGAGDRGCWSAENERIAREKRVKRVCIPKRGKADEERKAYEKQRWFRQGQRFRAGSEATISVLKRRNGMDRCRDEGQEGMDNWIALSCIARNLWTIAHARA